MTDTAIIAGTGILPARLAAAMTQKPLIAAMDGFNPRGLTPDVTFRVERLVPFLDHLQDAGIRRVCFAGAVTRPKLDPAAFDPRTAQMVPRLLGAMQQGDDATLRAVLSIFEEAGFDITGVEEIAPDLVPSAGLICGNPSERDIADAERAADIVRAMGEVDVGQGAVVQQGQCLAVEALPGTDAMLRFVATIPVSLRPDPGRGKGIFYKSVKQTQDRRVDLPTIGPETIDRVADAGLAGIAWKAGGVIALDLHEMRKRAEGQGLFLWARA